MIQALRRRLADAEQERDALVQRIQNLETIVTSEAWDALRDSSGEAPSLPDEAGSGDLDAPPEHEDPPSSTCDQAETLADRLRS